MRLLETASIPLDEYVTFALHLAQLARACLHSIDQSVDLEIKEDASPVTDRDRAIELRLRQEIVKSWPSHGVVGEEFGATGDDRDWVWILDPIDGTRQFVAGLPNFGTLIALAWCGQPVIGVVTHPWIDLTCLGVVNQRTTINGCPVSCDPVTDLSQSIVCLSDPDAYDDATLQGFQSVREQSHFNVYDGGCIGYTALAQGRVHVALNGPNLECFDIAALVPIVQGAGGCISDWEGRPVDSTSRGAIVATSSWGLHEQVLRHLT